VFVSDAEIHNLTTFWRSQTTAADVAARPMMSSLSAGEEPPASASWGNLGRKVERPPMEQVAFWDQDLDDEVSGADDDEDDGGDEDAMYEEAVEMVRRLNKASVSLLQRRLRIGYTRAARLIDLMEERGVVGPPTEGSKPREVLPEA
jgi:DNA segregation ATPase FtsK/SpoIIIE-like protein